MKKTKFYSSKKIKKKLSNKALPIDEKSFSFLFLCKEKLWRTHD